MTAKRETSAPAQVSAGLGEVRAAVHDLKAPRPRQILWKRLRMLVSLAMLGGIVYLARKYDVARAFHDADPVYILLGICAYMGGQLVAAKRWHSLLHRSGFQPPFLAVFRANTIGMYSSNFLPGVAGGDLVRPIALYGTATVHKPQLYASVVFERLCGIGSIVVLATIGGLWSGLTRGDWRYLTAAAVILAGIVALLGFAHLARHAPLTGSSRLMQMLHKFKEGSEHLMSYALHPGLVLIVLGYSILFQLGYILMFWCFLSSLGAHASLFSVLLAAPLAWLASMTPVSLNGLGVREGTLVLVLVQLGVPKAEVTGAALMGLVPLFLISALGALWSLRIFSHVGARTETGDN
ncbi:MAG TPA: lysylphosphatidylglycerol synthase transmembrane domain-containing protein [Gammaproteobacteria bacterium]|nr:lysylphosphatidylglycerol synthase transmembrane domain-containing protein [Gammaproteobacteria bacterium]